MASDILKTCFYTKYKYQKFERITFLRSVQINWNQAGSTYLEELRWSRYSFAEIALFPWRHTWGSPQAFRFFWTSHIGKKLYILSQICNLVLAEPFAI